MKARVLVAVVTIAVAVHALIFIALGHVARGKGPLIPTLAPTAAAAAKPATSKAPLPQPAATATSPASEQTRPTPAAQSRKPIHQPRRSRAEVAAPNAALDAAS